MKLFGIWQETKLEDEIFLLIEIPTELISSTLTEGRWQPTGHKDYWIRIDQPKVPHEKRHATIAHQKHISNRDKQVTWNYDGSRKDKKTFDVNFKGIEIAKDIVRKALNLGDDIKFECYRSNQSALLLENFTENDEHQFYKVKIS